MSMFHDLDAVNTVRQAIRRRGEGANQVQVMLDAGKALAGDDGDLGVCNERAGEAIQALKATGEVVGGDAGVPLMFARKSA